MDYYAILKSIHHIARNIQEEWDMVNCNYHDFPAIVLKHTENLDLSVFADLEIIIELLNLPEFAEIQKPSGFSDLYYKLFDNGKFWVEVLNWWGSDINIHDHDFAGVQFQVLGSALNVQYSFAPKSSIGGLDIGNIEVVKAELWKEGTKSVVVPGRAEPHNVSHLNDPTVSILFRTHPSRDFGSQRNYFPPFLAGNYGIADISFRKKVKALRLLSSHRNTERFSSAFRKVVKQQEPNQNLFVLIKMVDILFTERFSHLLQEFGQTSEIASLLVEASAYFRATELLAKGLKTSATKSISEVICMSALSSSFSHKSFDRINCDLLDANYELSLWRTLQDMLENLEGSDYKSLKVIINVLQLDLNNTVIVVKHE